MDSDAIEKNHESGVAVECFLVRTYGGVALKASLGPAHLHIHHFSLYPFRNIEMAPSVTETVAQAADQIQEKLSTVSLKDPKSHSEVKAEDGPAPAVQAPQVEEQHRKPLKLSGALDHFESFDVTPTIGREFVGVNLAKWLKAPNSDELIRDLAITSKIPHPR